MAKGRNKRKKAARVERSQKELFQEAVYGWLKASTVKQEDVVKVIALARKYAPQATEEQLAMVIDQFRAEEQGKPYQGDGSHRMGAGRARNKRKR